MVALEYLIGNEWVDCGRFCDEKPIYDWISLCGDDFNYRIIDTETGKVLTDNSLDKNLFTSELIELSSQSATIAQLNTIIKARDMQIVELREKLNKTEAKRDLEQQAKGVAMALVLESWSAKSLYGFEQDLRKQANEVDK